MSSNDNPLESNSAGQAPGNGDNIQVGDIQDGKAIAVGRGAMAIYHGLSYEEVVALFDELREQYKIQGWDGRVPYLGLKAFQESDAEFFFGREELVGNLLQRVEDNIKFIIIAGPSGSGKSSAARAGLFHALRQGEVEGSANWVLATMSPKDRPIDNLALALGRDGADREAEKVLLAEGLTNPLALHEQVERLRAMSDDPNRRFVLLVDQFEELFTQTVGEETREAFIKLLTRAAGMDEGRTIILLSLRSDFISNCALYPELRDQINKENQFQLVGALAPRDLAKAITLPSLEVGAEIEPALVKQIIDDMKGEPGALPLMSFALRDLFLVEKTKKGQPMDLTLQEYVDRGGIDQALERHADKVFASFTDEQKELAKGIFSKLITVGEGHLDTRRTASFEELKPAGVADAAVAAVVAKLSEEGVRLVTASGVLDEEELTAEEVAGAKPTVTIAHEKLIDAWPWLRRLIDENREFIALQNQINGDARDWAVDEDEGFLYRGGRLLNVEENLHNLQLDALSLRFIQASIEQRQAEAKAEEERIRQKEALRQEHANAGRFRRLTYGLSVAAVVALIATIIALFFMNTARSEANLAATSEGAALVAQSTSDANARLAASREAEARSAEGEANENARLLATSEAQARTAELEANTNAALAVTREAEARNAEAVARQAESEVESLKNRIQASQLAQASRAESDQELALLLATTGLGFSNQPDTIARFYETVFTPFRRSLYGHTDRVWSARFSPDGSKILTTSWDGSAKLWDLAGSERATLGDHTKLVWSAAFSPDGSKIVTTSWDNNARLWDLAGDPLASLDGHTDWVRSAVFSPDGTQILTASWDGSAKLWDLAGSELASFDEHTDYVRSAVFSPDGTQILTASDDNSAKLWDLAGNEIVTLDGHTSSVRSAVFSPDGTQILTASDDNTARLWDLEGNQLLVIDDHNAPVNLAIFSPQGTQILTNSLDGRATLWDLAGDQIASFEGDDRVVRSVAFSPDGRQIATVGLDGSAVLWNLDGEELASLDGHTDLVRSIAFSPDGDQIVTASWDGSARIWDISGDEQLELGGHQTAIRSAAFSPDGSLIVTAGTDGSGKLWDLAGAELASLDGHINVASSAVFSPDGSRIATASDDASAKLWDLAGNEIASLDGHGNWLSSVRFSPDGTRILTASEDSSARLWDLTGRQLLSIDGHPSLVFMAEFSPDGQQILTASADRSARLWDLNGEELVSFTGHTDWVRSAVFNPEGTLVLTASEDGSAKLWDLAGNQLASLEGHELGVNTAIFNKAGSLILTAGQDGSARLWNLNGNQLLSLEGHEEAVNTAVFSPDDLQILTAGEDGSARLWDLYGNQIASLEGHDAGVKTAVFSPDGSHILTVAQDGRVRLWVVLRSVNEQLAIARARLSRGFSGEECDRFFRDDPWSCPTSKEAVFALLDNNASRPAADPIFLALPTVDAAEKAPPAINAAQISELARPEIESSNLGPLVDTWSAVNHSIQHFESGITIWADNPAGADQIWVLVGEKEDEGSEWSQYDDTWNPQEDSVIPMKCSDAIDPENGPILGFGKIWCENQSARQAIGYPLEKETASNDATIEFYENGLLIFIPSQQRLWLLQNDGSWSSTGPP